jgi:DNA-binding beta-propeller fold protein YncE
MKPVLVAGAAAVVLAGTGLALAQQQEIRPYYVGNPLGVPIAPPAPTAENPPQFRPLTDNVKVYGGLVNTESCTYDPVRDLIVAPNRGVAQSIRANDGFVTFINHDGSVHTPRWIGIQNPGNQRDNMDTPLVLNEPFGSMVRNGILYLADRDGGTPDPANPGQNLPQTAAIAMFDMATGAPVGRMSLEVPAFNDIYVAEDGTIYASVSGNMGRVYKVTPDGTATELIPTGAPGLNSPNGLAMDPDGNLVVVNIGDNGVNTYNAETGELLLQETVGQPGLDGLEIMADGTKFVTSVQNGGVFMIPPGGESVMIADGVPSAASMCYDAGANQLVIPLNPNNGLAFVPLEGIWAP